jgi:dTMP kinase
MQHTPTVFIAIDGIDGVGKSTQLKSLSNLLRERGMEHLVTRDPGSSEIGRRLRELLLDSELTMHRRTEAMLFMASRCEMVETIIRPALRDGRSVLCDRFLLANVVYQSVATDGPADGPGVSPETGVSPKTLWTLGHLANDQIRPDLTILLDMPATEALRRLDRPADRMEKRGAGYMERVRQAYLEQLPNASDRTVVIRADQAPKQVENEITAAVTRFLDQPD